MTQNPSRQIPPNDLANGKFTLNIMYNNLLFVRSIICLIFFTLPLAAQSLSRLRLEESTDLKTWQSIAVTAEMIDSDGRMLLPTNSAERFYRMQVELIQPPTLIAQPSPATITSGSNATLSVTTSGTGPFTYQWYQGPLGTTTTPVGTNSSSFSTTALTATTTYWVRVTNAAGPVDSGLATVTVATAPSITNQPASTTIISGQRATLTVTASGTAPLSYQWYQGSVGITTTPVGENSSSFTTPVMTTTMTYWVRVSNLAGNINSSIATVTVNQPVVAPSITTQPSTMTIVNGSTATFTVSAGGTAPLAYQWYRGPVGTTTAPVGTNSSSFTSPLLNASTSYWVRISNSVGNVNSSLANATVISAPTAPTGFSLISGGGFTMGRTSGDADEHAPSVTVNISNFYMGKHEVTKALWEEVRTWAVANSYTDLVTGEGKATNHPVQTVSWWDVVKWCNARSQKDGLTPVYTVNGAVMKTGTTTPEANWRANGYRLPTEAEWEKAARGGVSGKRFPWGTDTISHSQANYYAFSLFGASAYDYDLSAGAVSKFHPTYAINSQPYTSPVGSFAANGYSLHDMTGNVAEWCWDWYLTSSYVNGVTDPRGAASGTNKVVRGYSWSDSAIYGRCSFRGYITPYPDRYHDRYGFRVARSSVP